MHRILYHMDADGHASGAIVATALLRDGVEEKEIDFHPINYGMEVPLLDYKNDNVYMVDFSLQPDEKMVDFCEKLGDRLVWIDHHDTAVDIERKYNLHSVGGLRAATFYDLDGRPDDDRKISACELVWIFNFPNDDIPRFIELIGEWDTWRWKDMDQSDAPLMMFYLRSDDFNPKRNLWWWRTNINLALEHPEAVESSLNDDWLPTGSALRGYQVSQDKGLMYSKAFEGEFAGHSAILVNQLGNSEMFKALYDPKKHDLRVTFQFIKGQYWSISFYSENPDIHCGDLAKKLGEAGPIPSGGGHAGAAGFQTTWEYLSTLITVPE